MLVEPLPLLIASPVLPTIATAGAEDVHCATEDTSCCVPSLKVAVAVNCWVTPSATDAFAGEIASDCTDAFVTVRDALEAFIPWKEALIVTVPGATPVARPLLMVAIVNDVVCQYPCRVRSCVEP